MTAGSQTLPSGSSSPATIFDSDADGTCTGFSITNTAAVKIEINVVPLHKAGEYFPIAAGVTQQFISKNDGIRKITGYGVGATAVIEGGVFAK